MPKSKDPRGSAHPEATPAEGAKAIIERHLAQKKNGGPPGFGKAGGVHKPGKGGWSPAPIRPGGRGRRG